jgi:thiamine-monophosphate kinase
MARGTLEGLGEAEIIKMLAEAFEIEDLDDGSPLPDDGLYASSDLMLESTDLPDNIHPMFWGFRFIAANVSDMAAMGCQPSAMMISLGLPEKMKTLDFKDLLEGMKWACREAGMKVVGGDTNSSGELILSGFIAGRPVDVPFTRGGARPGDVVFVTGNPGAAALGLAIIQKNGNEYFDSPDLLEEKTEGSSMPLGAFLVPEMRIKETEDLAQLGAVTSCIDISDGISTDAGHIASSSGVGILIEEDFLPFPSVMRGIAKKMKLDPAHLALNGGDDFELLFTSPPEFTEQIRESEIGLVIGEVVDEPGVHLKDAKGRVERLKSSGYQHFAGRGR